jgi:U3 small nucleolar RNA-associated protein 18
MLTVRYQLFFLDSGPSPALAKALIPSSTPDHEDVHTGRDRPAWEDSDDERIMVSLASATRLRKLRRTEEEDVINGKEYIRRLRQQFEKLNPVPDWVDDAAHSQPRRKRRRTTNGAESSSEEESDDEMEVDNDSYAQPLARLLRDASSLVKSNPAISRKRKLQPEVLDIQRMRDIANGGPSAVTTLQIHLSLPLLIASGPSASMALYYLHPPPPDHNTVLTNIHIKNTPLTTTSFHPSSADPRIFLSARRRYFHVWNLESGQIEKITRIYGQQTEQHVAFLGSARKGGGVLNILDAKTLQWTAQARVESHGGIAEFEWWRDGTGLCIAGKNGEVTEWSLDTRSAVTRWNDEGAVGTTIIALGGASGRNALGGDRWIAIGSSSGIVNIYDRRQWASTGASADAENSGIPRRPKPTKALDHLTTPTSHLSFSPDGELLCMASRWKKDALRLVHLPSCTVYKNWPTASTPFGRISAIAWGDVDGALLLTVGNEAGNVRCWEVKE